LRAFLSKNQLRIVQDIKPNFLPTEKRKTSHIHKRKERAENDNHLTVCSKNHEHDKLATHNWHKETAIDPGAPLCGIKVGRHGEYGYCHGNHAGQ
jgi:hypothetical protein